MTSETSSSTIFTRLRAALAVTCVVGVGFATVKGCSGTAGAAATSQARMSDRDLVKAWVRCLMQVTRSPGTIELHGDALDIFKELRRRKATIHPALDAEIGELERLYSMATYQASLGYPDGSASQILWALESLKTTRSKW